MFKEHKIIMLPSDDIIDGRHILKCIKSFDLGYIDDFHNTNTEGTLSYSYINTKFDIAHGFLEWNKEHYQSQHLYIISDEQIKINDWCINIKSDTLFQIDQSGIDYMYRTKSTKFDHWFEEDLSVIKKVIASTDKLLNLPQLPIEFIEKYCELGGIDTVNVEYIQYPNKIGSTIGEGIIDGFKNYIKCTPNNIISIDIN